MFPPLTPITAPTAQDGIAILTLVAGLSMFRYDMFLPNLWSGFDSSFSITKFTACLMFSTSPLMNIDLSILSLVRVLRRCMLKFSSENSSFIFRRSSPPFPMNKPDRLIGNINLTPLCLYLAPSGILRNSGISVLRTQSLILWTASTTFSLSPSIRHTFSLEPGK